MAYILLLRIFIFVAAIVLSLQVSYTTASAQVNKSSDDVAQSTGEESYLLDKNMIDIIDKYSLNNKANNIANMNVINNTTGNNESNLNNSPQYLNNGILANSNVSLLKKMVPSEYSILDMPKRDNSPIHRLNTSSKMNYYPEYENTFAGIANILLDTVFGALTRNTLSMNINRIQNSDNINFSITPIKGLALKIGLEDYTRKADKSIFEVKYKYSNATNIKVKTSESSSETKAGIEFELSF